MSTPAQIPVGHPNILVLGIFREVKEAQTLQQTLGSQPVSYDIMAGRQRVG